MFTSNAGVFKLHLPVGSDSSKDQDILTWLTQTFLMVWHTPAVAHWSQLANARNCTKLSELPMRKIGRLFLVPLVKFVLLPRKSDSLEMGKP